MAKLVDILQVEKDRQEEAMWAVVHLFKTGSFYSAYEWSAWLIAVITFNDGLPDCLVNPKPYFARLLEHVEFLTSKNHEQQVLRHSG